MRGVVAAGVLAVTACRGERTGTIVGPPLTVAPATATATPTSPPLSAAFHDLSSSTRALAFARCHEVLVTPIIGTARLAGDQLAPGDVLAVRGLSDSNQTLSGTGLALVVTATDTECATRKRLVRASQAPTLTFMRGAMHAKLDVDDRDVAPFYLGRLTGSAGVPEHVHDQSWEILCAVEAAGTFTMAGNESRLGARTCISVPPGTKHSWRPDPGSNFVAVQMYSPPGPEQRFKKLAGDEAARDR